MRALARLVPLLLLPLTACFQIDYGLTLERDLSGRADLDFTVDLDQVAFATAHVQRAFQGLEGPPTAEEIEAARAEIRAQMDEGAFREDSLRQEIAADLPEGVEVIDARRHQDGMRMGVTMAFRFDHVERLQEIGVETAPAADADSRPFGNLRIVDEGDTFVLRNEPIDPVEQAERNATMLEGDEGFIETLFRDLRITFSVRAPFEVVEHNATERDGDRLSWVYDYEAMKSGTPAEIYVRYRK